MCFWTYFCLLNPQLRLWKPHLWSDRQPPQPPEDVWRVVRGGGGSHRRGRLSARHRQWHRRQHPHPGVFLRHLWLQADIRPREVSAAVTPPAAFKAAASLSWPDLLFLCFWLSLHGVRPIYRGQKSGEFTLISSLPWTCRWPFLFVSFT